MNFLSKTVLVLVYLCAIPWIAFPQAQLLAPPDVVVSEEFEFDITKLADPNDSTFGRLGNPSSDRLAIKTIDKVCRFYCEANPYLAYPGPTGTKPNPLPATDIACNYFHTLYDNVEPLKKYELDWGIEGYMEDIDSASLKIQVIDYRKCNLGEVRRIISAEDSQKMIHIDSQSIWIVDCKFSTPTPVLVCSTYVNLFLDENCELTLHASQLLKGGPYACLDHYIVSAIDASTNESIDRNLHVKGIQLNKEDIERNIFINTLDPVIGNSCRTDTFLLADSIPPNITYPDTLRASFDFNCRGYIEFPPPLLDDNCSDSIRHFFVSPVGVLTGTETTGFRLDKIPEGIHEIDLIAKDVSENFSHRKIILTAINNNPPVDTCPKQITIKINGNQAPGNNFAIYNAISLEDSSRPLCNFYGKVIKVQDLKGSKNGTKDDNSNACAARNGDDDNAAPDTQVYFDDFAAFCCDELNVEYELVNRFFRVDPGSGPVSPERMEANGDLFQKFSDCITLIKVQDVSIPTLQAPPDVVVSCAFPIDIEKLKDPNDVTFGRMVNELANRRKVITRDIVCKKYCIRDFSSGYPGYDSIFPPSNPPAANRACDFYNSLFDIGQPTQKYEMVWGFDGYVLSTCTKTPKIEIEDRRKNGKGLIKRTIIAFGPDRVIVRATQSIWVVDCDEPDKLCKTRIFQRNLAPDGCAELTAAEISEKEEFFICKPNENLHIYFDADTLKKVIKVCCEDFVAAKANDRLSIDIDLYIQSPDGKLDSCPIVFVVYDSADLCLNTAVNDQAYSNKLQITPNPSNGEFVIHCTELMDEIRISNIQGKVVMTNKFQPTHLHKASLLQTGLYSVEVFRSNRKLFVQKLLVGR